MGAVEGGMGCGVVCLQNHTDFKRLSNQFSINYLIGFNTISQEQFFLSTVVKYIFHLFYETY